MENHDYSQGGEHYGKWYPALKPLELAIRTETPAEGVYIHYEPGNGTRYEVVFTKFKTKYEEQILMSIFCPRNCSMIIPPHEFGIHDIVYMQEKTGMMEGDCYALIPLINEFVRGL